jgi:hypothetical protein
MVSTKDNINATDVSRVVSSYTQMLCVGTCSRSKEGAWVNVTVFHTLISSLWLMARAECSRALMTEAYESENFVYFPTRAMDTCSRSRSDLRGDSLVPTCSEDPGVSSQYIF